MYEKIFNKPISKIIEEKNNKLYHYTTISALQGMLLNKEIWLGNALNMNDRKELLHLSEIIKEKLIKELPQKVENIDSYFNEIEKSIKSKDHYAFCLTEYKDDVSMWERYADNGTGVRITFNIANFLNVVRKVEIVLLNEVFYETKAENHTHYKILKKFFETGKLDEFNNIESQKENLIATSTVHKHPSFSSEREYRTITLLDRKNYDNEYCITDFINTGSNIKKFLKIKYDKICEKEKFDIVKNNKICSNEKIDFHDLFEDILIGPRSKQNVNDLKNFCIDCDFYKLAEKIYKSDCPLI